MGPGEPRATEATSPPASSTARVATLVIGYLLLVTGTALLVLPGPGIPLVLAGLAVVGREQRWARRLERRLRDRVSRVWRARRTPT